ncbi:LuxR C-terminal-related transcriptional regulator [Streptomyces sp. JV176]|uniref:LuxR C-terminal-related transcriptional regulator n=1 Tax=Streptomyces sp. JV176 TaxID=858630 RepID=UPI002E76D715|nr:LuxR C-terminal-related transcriptional regulator [Streptomyces sp. JV176]MEE1800974.1 LuxR C-terminal-related transcriptional regulator [Streptomyces sp. JV176]
MPIAVNDVETFHRALLMQSGISVAVIDAAGGILWASPSFLHYFSGAGEKVVGECLSGFFHPGVKGRLDYLLNEVLEGRRIRFSEEVTMVRENGGCVGGNLVGVAVGGFEGGPGLLALWQPDRSWAVGVNDGDKKVTVSDMGRRILEGVACGLSTAKLASRLYMSKNGVSYHLGELMREFQADNRTELVSRAYSVGLLKVGTWPPAT